MQYSVATFTYSFAQEWEYDVFCQALADIGFEVFSDNEVYIPTAILHAHTHELDDILMRWPQVKLLSIAACKDENWNATWEAAQSPIELPMGVRITPHCAFGAGTHETTSMIVDYMTEQDEFFRFKKVLDMGCGTGVLGIMAKKCGAQEVLAVDIDDKSVMNTRENAIANQVVITVQLGDTPPKGAYDLILANIHRNILIAQMPLYASYLQPMGQVWLSGFLQDDVPLIVQAGEAVGLHCIAQRHRGEWQMIILEK